MDPEIQRLIETAEVDNNSFYLAGPFFTPEQIARIELVEKIAEESKYLICRSPRKFLVLQPKASWAERKKVFVENCKAMIISEFVLANLDKPHDSGTLWEMGFAYALGKPVIGFCLGESKMNVMLAQGCEGFLEDERQLREFLGGLKTDEMTNARTGKEIEPGWHVAQVWRKDIF